jgi:bacteriocin-like protein
MTEHSDQTQQNTSAAQELRQQLLDALSAQQQAIEELNDEELDTVTGGISFGGFGRVESFASHASSEASFHSAVDDVEHTAQAAKKGIPTAWKAASAGIASGAAGSFVVGSVAGKLSVSGG